MVRHHDRDQPPIGPDARVDDGEVDRPGGNDSTIPASTNAPSRMFCGAIEWRDVDELRPGREAEDDPLHRGHIGPVGPKSVVSVTMPIPGFMSRPSLFGPRYTNHGAIRAALVRRGTVRPPRVAR